MRIKKMYFMQERLDMRIIKEKGLEDWDLLENTVTALLVELGECANEWRGFKHWSNDRKPRTEKLLVEYVDCLHFFLSIARQIQLDPEELYDVNTHIHPEGSTANIFTTLFYQVGRIGLSESFTGKEFYFRQALELFMTLGRRLGFSWSEITDAYVAKNEENHVRQATGY